MGFYILQKLKKKENKIRLLNYLLIPLLLVSIIFSLFILQVYQIAISASFLLIGYILFLLIEKRKPFKEKKFEKLWFSDKHVNLIFALLFLVSLSILISYGIPSFRPFSFFVCIGLMFGIISIEIANLNEGKNLDRSHIFSILLKAIVVSYLLKITFFIGVHSDGADSSYHFLRALALSQNGTIESMPGYSDMPFYHVFWASSSMILGVDLDLAKFVMIFIPSLGILFMYLFAKVFTSDEKASLYSALIFSFFSLTNRIRTQTEALVFPVLFLLLLYFSFRSEDRSPKDSLNFIILFIALAYTHFYYSFLFLILLSLAFLTAILFKSIYENEIFKDKISNLFFLCGVLYTARVIYSTMSLEWSIDAVIEVITSPISLEPRISLPISEPNPLQFLCVHLSELLMCSLSIVAIFLLLKKVDAKNLLLLSSFIGILLVTIISILALGGLKWGIGYRNFYMIALFLCFLGGYALRNLELVTKNKKKIIAAFFIFFATLSFFSIGSEQGNFLDPVFYSGDVPSPMFISYSEIKATGDLFSYLPRDCTILGDYRTLDPANLALALVDENFRPFKVKTFSEPYLPELSENYDYLIINNYSVERGIILAGYKDEIKNILDLYFPTGCERHKGLEIDKGKLLGRIKDMDRIWDSEVIKVYAK
jgi:hypothetical protein